MIFQKVGYLLPIIDKGVTIVTTFIPTFCYNSLEVIIMMKKIQTLIRFIFLTLFLFLMVEGNIQNWFKIFGVTLVIAIFFGRLYCSYICPMNTLMIYTEKISQKFGIQKDTIPNILKWKYMSALVLLITIIINIVFKVFLNKTIPFILVFLIISVLTTIFFKQELFHNYICPFGLFQNLFAKKAIYSHRVDLDKCIGCKLCEKSCPNSAIKVEENKKAYIDKSLCLQCSNCKYVCPTKAISYSK